MDTIIHKRNINIYKKELNIGKIKQTQIKMKYIRFDKIKKVANLFYYIKIFNLLLLLNSFIQTLLNKNPNILKFLNSNITLKIKGIGYRNIFGIDVGNNFEKQYYPNEIHINGNKQDIINHTYYFNLTDNIVELFWNHSITNCRNMFRKSYNMTEINLFNFDTSNVKTTYCMFFACTSLTSVNLSNFETSKVEEMSGMFQNCYSLTSLNLSSFNTAHVKYMGSMFRQCYSLTSLDLSNFNTLNVERIEVIFEGCTNLEYLNLNNFDENQFNYYPSMFENIANNIVICINEGKNKDKILPQIKQISCPTIDCSDDWKSKQKKIINETGECINSCEDSSIYKYEYNGQCYNICTNGLLYEKLNNNRCKCELEKCLLCPPVPLSKKLCTKCNENYYQMENDPSNLGEYFNCYNELKGYYLDKNDSLFKKCYLSCETCDKKGDNITHNCLTCDINFSISFNISQNKYINCYNKSNEEILNTLKENLFSMYNPENGKSFIIKGKNNITFQVTNGNNEMELLVKGSLDNQNLSIIDLGECETKLKNEYNINETLSLIYIKQENSLAKPFDKNIQYEVFHPINFTKLNLSICSENTINIYVKFDFSHETKKLYEELKSKGFDMFNINDQFYHDVCIPYNYDNDVDILLSDRINYIYNNKDAQCQPNCQFSSYLSNSLYMNCTCNAISDNNIIEDKKFNGKILYKSFFDVLKYSNFLILKCYNSVFTKNIFHENLGNIITLICFSFCFSCFIVYIIKGIKPVKNNVLKIMSVKIEERTHNKRDKVDNILLKYLKDNPVKKKKNSVNYKNKNKKLKKLIPKININYKFKSIYQ